MKSLAIIPAYNEDKNILEEVVEKTKKYVSRVLVIDDGSKIPLKIKNCVLLRNEPNQGKGNSLIRGFNYAIKNNFDIIITLDADGEHNPEDIPNFLEKINNYDFVIGERKVYRNLKRKLLNRFATFWFTLLIPGIKDMYCGFRAIKVNKLKNIPLKQSSFELEPEMLLESVKKNIKIGFVDIETKSIEKTHFSFNNYLNTNDLYDRWVLENYKELNINIFKKLFLLGSAKTGLIITKLIK